MLYHQVTGHSIFRGGEDNVGKHHSLFNKELEGRLNMSLMLLNHRFKIPTYLSNALTIKLVHTDILPRILVSRINLRQSLVSASASTKIFKFSIWRTSGSWKAKMPSKMMTVAPYIGIVRACSKSPEIHLSKCDFEIRELPLGDAWQSCKLELWLLCIPWVAWGCLATGENQKRLDDQSCNHFE